MSVARVRHSMTTNDREGLRDQIALHALAGFIAAGRGYTIEQIAEAAYQLADAMLAERAK